MIADSKLLLDHHDDRWLVGQFNIFGYHLANQKNICNMHILICTSPEPEESEGCVESVQLCPDGCQASSTCPPGCSTGCQGCQASASGCQQRVERTLEAQGVAGKGEGVFLSKNNSMVKILLLQVHNTTGGTESQNDTCQRFYWYFYMILLSLLQSNYPVSELA